MAEGRGERTIGSGHLVALFLGIVVLCSVFFILGYEMGRAQFERGSGATVAVKPAAPAPAATKEEPPSPGWPSGSAGGASAPGKAGSPTGTGQPATPGKATAASGPSAGAKRAPPNDLKAPEIPRGAIVLQVAANRNESDALNLARLLQEKGFPAFVLTPSTDDWYRVQVGPYADAKSADQAKAALAHEGFKAIAKR